MFRPLLLINDSGFSIGKFVISYLVICRGYVLHYPRWVTGGVKLAGPVLVFVITYQYAYNSIADAVVFNYTLVWRYVKAYFGFTFSHAIH